MKISDIIRIPLRIVLSPLLDGVTEKRAWYPLQVLIACTFVGMAINIVWTIMFKLVTNELYFDSFLGGVLVCTLISYCGYSLLYHIDNDLFSTPVKQIYRLKNWLLNKEQKD